MSYYVYILGNARHTVFYVGVTNNLSRRIAEHKMHLNRGFTSKYLCDQLLYFEEYSSIKEAIAREKQLKKFKRDWKVQLILKQNPEWNDFSQDW